MKRILHLVMGILGMLLAIALAVTVTLNSRWLYIAVMESENLESATGYSRAEILDNYDAVINYNSIFGPNKLELPSMAMSEGGRIHIRAPSPRCVSGPPHGSVSGDFMPT